MRQCALTPHIFKFAFSQICVAIFWSQSFQHTPLKILVKFESEVYVFSGVLCRNAWNSAIHLFIIWFTDILANLDIQTDLQDCLYEYGFKDKWYRLELLASTLCTTQWLYKDLWWSNVAVKRPLSRPQHILMPRKGTILSFKQVLMGVLFFSVSSVSFQALFISLHLLIITLFQEDNIFGTNASLTYGPQIQRHTCVW